MLSCNTSIKDFGYGEDHPLHKGAANEGDLDSESGYEYDEALKDFEDKQYSNDEINRKAIALFDFLPENDNEVALKEGQLIWISYRHGQGWLVAEDPETGENGLVPEEYVEIWYEEDEDVAEMSEVDEAGEAEDNTIRQGSSQYSKMEEDVPKRFLPEILHYEEDEWVDTDEEDEGNDDEEDEGNDDEEEEVSIKAGSTKVEAEAGSEHVQDGAVETKTEA